MSNWTESWIFWTDFQKYSGIKFNGKTPSGSRVVPCGQTDRHDEANCRFPQFCERAYKWTTCWSATPTQKPRSATSTLEPVNDSRRTRWLTGNLWTRQIRWIRGFVELLKTRRPTGERRRRSRRPSCERNRSGSKWTSDPWRRVPDTFVPLTGGFFQTRSFSNTLLNTAAQVQCDNKARRYLNL